MAKRVLGIDCSTKSFGFAFFEDGKFIKCGEIFFNGADIFERLSDCNRKLRAINQEFQADYVGIEAAIMVKDIQAAIKLAYVFGAAMAAVGGKAKVETIAPITWQSYLGNPLLTKIEKDGIVAAHPNKSKTWYQNEGRKLRKQRTLSLVKDKFGIITDSDNVGDAIGLGWYVMNNRVTNE